LHYTLPTFNPEKPELADFRTLHLTAWSQPAKVNFFAQKPFSKQASTVYPKLFKKAASNIKIAQLQSTLTKARYFNQD
jgi:hypothetical protein